MYKCTTCAVEKKIDRFTFGHTICKPCEIQSSLKMQSVSVNVSPCIKEQLSEQHIPQQDVQMQSLSAPPIQVPSFNAIEEFKDVLVTEFQMSELQRDFEEDTTSVISSKRQKTYDVLEQQSLYSTNDITVVYHADQDVVQQLREMKDSELPDLILAQQIQSLSELFTQDLIFAFFKQEEHKRLNTLICIVQERVGQLNDKQVLGIALVSFAIGGVCWQGTVKMLGGLTDRAVDVMSGFQCHLTKQIGEILSQWVCQYWKHMDQQHIILTKYMSQMRQVRAHDILLVSLAVAVEDPYLFVVFVGGFVSVPVATLLLKAIKNRPRQQRIPFDDFVELTGIVQAESNKIIIEEKETLLMQSPVFQWKSSFALFKTQMHLKDAESVQQFLDRLIEVYGEIDIDFASDLTKRDDFYILTLGLHEAENQPNSRQYAMAQYSAGKLMEAAHQLLIVPSGQGKSRIAASLAAIVLFAGMFEKVHFVFENEHLLQRDKADFDEVWMLLSFESKVSYHVGLQSFEPTEKTLVIVDEADTFMLGDTESFILKTLECACVCFTATPDNCDDKGTEARVIQQIEFTPLKYDLDGNNAQPVTFDVDEVVLLNTDTEKAAYIKQQQSEGPVLVFGQPSLTSELVQQGCSVTLVTQEIDPDMLRHLDQQPYKILIVQDQFGGRGIDYRCGNATMTMIVARPFENRREALQGFSRVGRFGDACRRIRFNDVQIVDRKQEIMYTRRLILCVQALSTKVFKKKPLKVKKAIAGKTAKKVQQLLSYTAQQAGSDEKNQ